MTPWQIVAVGFAVALLLAVLLQHRAEMVRARAAIRPVGDDYERGTRDGMETAARICDSGGTSYGDMYARQIRAAARKDDDK